MAHTAETAGIWKYSKLIIALLVVLFLVSIGTDVVLWYSVQKSHTAAQILNEIIASQPQAPKTDVDKTKLLDALAAAHAEAAAQVAGQTLKTNQNATTAPVTSVTASAPTPAQSAADQAKIKLLNSLSQPR